MNVLEAKLILENELARYRAKSYEQLISLLGQPETFERVSPSGTKYQIEMEVFFDDDSKTTLRVSAAIDDGGWRAFSPLCDDFLITPDVGRSWMKIRDEEQEDWPAVHDVNLSAFGTPIEANLVDTLREQAHPIVSLVATEGETIVGHIMFSPVSLSHHQRLNIMGLAPMAVLPEFQRKGIGSALVRAGLERCKHLGTGAVVVLGHPEYYPRFGFQPATRFDIRCEYDVPDEAFMLIELLPGYLRGSSGTIKYHAAFSAL